jgi:hypothetical protein
MRFRHAVAITASATLAVAALIGGPAQADTFTPKNDPPTVLLTTVPGSSTGMQPAAPRSTSTYTLSLTVASQGTVANLKEVHMCWYNRDASPAASRTCSNATTDPTNEFHMKWVENGTLVTGGTFSVLGTNKYANNGSVADYQDGTALSMNIDFKFKISEAMAYSQDWAVHVWATDDQDQASIEDDNFVYEYDYVSYNNDVNYFGAVLTQRSSQAFGDLQGGASFSVENTSTGNFQSNGASVITMEATDFTNGLNTVALSQMGTPLNGSGEAELRCNDGATFDNQFAYSIGSDWITGIHANVLTQGTGESTDSSFVHSCNLYFAGGAPKANVQYSNTVTIGITDWFGW